MTHITSYRAVASFINKASVFKSFFHRSGDGQTQSKEHMLLLIEDFKASYPAQPLHAPMADASVLDLAQATSAVFDYEDILEID